MNEHGLELHEDGDGWVFAHCLCGWGSGPCTDNETAADRYTDHRVDAELEAMA